MKRLFSKSLIKPLTVFAITLLSACSSLDHAARSSTSLSNFLGFSELPDWYVTSKYTYPDSKWIENDFNTRIHYRDIGEGPVIILLHGEISSLHIWEPWIELLRNDFRLIAIDLPGSGLTSGTHCMKDKSRTCADNLSGDYIAHTIEYFIEDLGLDKFSIIGSSYGGYLAAQYASLQHPEKLEKLILISPKGFTQELPKTLDYVTSDGFNIVSRYVQPSAIITQIVHDFYADTNLITPAVTERYLHLAQSEGAHKSNITQLELVRELMEKGMLLDLASIEIPTLIMWGKSDKWGDFAHAEQWKNSLPNSTLVTYPNYGHSLMEEGKELTAADAAAFINDEAIPSLDEVGEGFSISDEMNSFDQGTLFGPAEAMEDAE